MRTSASANNHCLLSRPVFARTVFGRMKDLALEFILHPRKKKKLAPVPHLRPISPKRKKTHHPLNLGHVLLPSTESTSPNNDFRRESTILNRSVLHPTRNDDGPIIGRFVELCGGDGGRAPYVEFQSRSVVDHPICDFGTGAVDGPTVRKVESRMPNVSH